MIETNKSGFRVGALFFATMFPQTIVSMLSSTPSVIGSQIAEAFHLPVTVAGGYTGIIYAMVFVGTALAAKLISRWGPLRLSFACVAVASLGLAAFASGNVLGLILGTTLIGLSYGPLTPASSQVIARQPRTKTFALFMSIRQTSVPLGAALAGLIVPIIVLHLGWRATCWSLALCSLAAATISSLVLGQVREESTLDKTDNRGGMTATLKLILSNRRLLSLALGSVAFGAVQLILSSFMVIYLTTVVGHSLVIAGIMMGLSQIAGVVGRIGWGMAADKIPVPRKLIPIIGYGMVISCLAMAGLSLIGPTLLTVPVVILFGATATGWNGVFIAEIVREVEPADAALATSGSLMFCYAGIVVGPPSFGGLGAIVGLPSAYVAAALVSLAGAILMKLDNRTTSCNFS